MFQSFQSNVEAFKEREQLFELNIIYFIGVLMIPCIQNVLQLLDISSFIFVAEIFFIRINNKNSDRIPFKFPIRHQKFPPKSKISTQIFWRSGIFLHVG